MKHQVLFCLKSNEKVFMNVVCCSRNWHFKGHFAMWLKLVFHFQVMLHVSFLLCFHLAFSGPLAILFHINLSLKRQSQLQQTTFINCSSEKIRLDISRLHILCMVEDSHKTSSLIFSKR